MSGILTIGIILGLSYIIALGLERKATKEMLEEKALRLQEKEDHANEISRYELEIMVLSQKLGEVK